MQRQTTPEKSSSWLFLDPAAIGCWKEMTARTILSLKVHLLEFLQPLAMMVIIGTQMVFPLAHLQTRQVMKMCVHVYVCWCVWVCVFVSPPPSLSLAHTLSLAHSHTHTHTHTHTLSLSFNLSLWSPSCSLCCRHRRRKICSCLQSPFSGLPLSRLVPFEKKGKP